MNNLLELAEDILALVRSEPYLGWKKPKSDPSLLTTDYGTPDEFWLEPPKREEIRSLGNEDWVEIDSQGRQILHRSQPHFVQTL